jgi:predicted dehydrogenase
MTSTFHPAADGPRTTRRELLKSGATAAALGTIARPLFAANTAPKKIRMGIVGGRFGLGFQWHEHPDCVVAAVSDLRDERRDALMKTYRCTKSYPSLEELVKDPEIDAVAIYTEGPNHVKHTIECMCHGKHVISAVPAAWGTLDQCHLLRDTVRRYGLTYMMAETSYFQQTTISARKFLREGQFGEVFYCESEYQHAGLESLYFENGERTWRYGMAPMYYPTHCTAHLVSVTGRRLTEVVCHGWGDDNPILKDNAYKNPFWNESAMFKTDQGRGFRVNIWWYGAHRGGERAQWLGTKMSFYAPHPNGLGPVIVRTSGQTEKDSGGFDRQLPKFEQYQQPEWWKTEMLPEPLRHKSGHEGSHAFLTHEFIDSLTHQRKPVVDVAEALAYTAPGIVAHESALQGGALLKIPSFD